MVFSVSSKYESYLNLAIVRCIQRYRIIVDRAIRNVLFRLCVSPWNKCFSCLSMLTWWSHEMETFSASSICLPQGYLIFQTTFWLLNYIDICPMSPRLSCSGTCHVWKWYSARLCFDNNTTMRGGYYGFVHQFWNTGKMVEGKTFVKNPTQAMCR